MWIIIPSVGVIVLAIWFSLYGLISFIADIADEVMKILAKKYDIDIESVDNYDVLVEEMLQKAHKDLDANQLMHEYEKEVFGWWGGDKVKADAMTAEEI